MDDDRGLPPGAPGPASRDARDLRRLVTLMPVLRALLVDFGGTLDSDGRHWSTQLAHSFAAAGVERERTILDRAFLATDRSINQDPEAGHMTWRPYVEAHVARMAQSLALELEPSRRSRMVAAAAAAFRDSAERHLRRSRVLLEGARRHLRVAVVSNFTANLPRLLDELDLTPVLDAVICSACEGVRKPDPAIFRLALARLGVRPEEAAMIGDSLGNDIVPAKALGLTTVWLRGDEDFSHAAGSATAAADHTVATFEEALSVVTAGLGGDA